MAEPTLESVFGPGAIQDELSFTIQKAPLQSKGLIPSANNSAESLLVATNLYAKDTLTEENFNSNLDQSLIILKGTPSFTDRGTETPYRTDEITIRLHKPDSDANIKPSDY